MKRTPIKPEDTETINDLLKQISANTLTINKLSMQSADLNRKIFHIASNGDESLLKNALINHDNTELISFENDKDRLRYALEELKTQLVQGKHYELAASVQDIEKKLLNNQ